MPIECPGFKCHPGQNPFSFELFCLSFDDRFILKKRGAIATLTVSRVKAHLCALRKSTHVGEGVFATIVRELIVKSLLSFCSR